MIHQNTKDTGIVGYPYKRLPYHMTDTYSYSDYFIMIEALVVTGRKVSYKLSETAVTFYARVTL